MPLSSSFFIGSNQLEGVLAGTQQPVRPSLVKDTGDTVERIQKALVHLGHLDATKFKTGGPDGYYGEDTRKAVIAFQQTIFPPSQYLEWDGRVGPKTLLKLDEKLPGGSPSGKPDGRSSGKDVNPAVARITALCDQNSLITLDGTTAIALKPAMTSEEWIKETQESFDLLCRNDLGKKFIDLIKEPMTVVPYLRIDKDTGEPIMSAETFQKNVRNLEGITYTTPTVAFTARVFVKSKKIGMRADEVLFHEFVHALAPTKTNYPNPADNSMTWDEDFYTINATNVYISNTLSGRKLRKDHGPLDHFAELPIRYVNAAEHMVIFRENYDTLYLDNHALFELLKTTIVAPWNPFRKYTRKPTKMIYRVKVHGYDWKWIVELYDDSAKTARWRDPENIASYGSGTWSNGQDQNVYIAWIGGSWDRFPRPTNLLGAGKAGTCAVAGAMHDTVVFLEPSDPGKL
jgi:Putative peptidoglycan binding domain